MSFPSQNSLVTVDKESKTYRFNYEYYLMKHLSHFVLPDARMLENDGAYTNALLFENVDGSIVVLLQNDEKEDKQIALHLEDKTYFVNVLADSFSSIVIE